MIHAEFARPSAQDRWAGSDIRARLFRIRENHPHDSQAKHSIFANAKAWDNVAHNQYSGLPGASSNRRDGDAARRKDGKRPPHNPIRAAAATEYQRAIHYIVSPHAGAPASTRPSASALLPVLHLEFPPFDN